MRQTILAVATCALAGCASTEASRIISTASLVDPPPTSNSIESEASTSSSVGPEPAEQEATEEKPAWGTGRGKNYLIPALDIIGFEFLLNQIDRLSDEETYGTDASSIEDNLGNAWVIDKDPFATNQFLHPYQGSMYHGFARSAGLNYWTALGYDFAGSTLWEIAGETDPPSANDEITTTFGGSFLGEALFRMSNLVLEGGGEHPSFARSFGAGLISPASGFNRLAFGKRFDAIYDSREPATFWMASIGGRRNAKVTEVEELSDLQEDEALAEVRVEYGLPGKPGYEYKRPFDYFHFDATLTSSAHAIPESVAARGLLVGSDYEAGHSYRGIWGLYGSYDYLSPELFSVSSTALSLGTTGQFRATDSIAIQGTLLGGIGWTAVGTIADVQEDRDYRYGYSPQALLDLRTIFGSAVVFDITARDYYLSGTSSLDSSGNENILRVDTGLTIRVYGRHAIGLRFVASRRDSTFTEIPDTLQEVGALSLVYTYLGDTKLGAVRW